MHKQQQLLLSVTVLLMLAMPMLPDLWRHTARNYTDWSQHSWTCELITCQLSSSLQKQQLLTVTASCTGAAFASWPQGLGADVRAGPM
jgi:hypothetical protein